MIWERESSILLHWYAPCYASRVWQKHWDVQHWANFNVTRRGHTTINVTKEYALTASKDPEIQKVFYQYFPEWKITGNPEKDIYNYFTSDKHPIEMEDNDYLNYMVWLRGLDRL